MLILYSRIFDCMFAVLSSFQHAASSCMDATHYPEPIDKIQQEFRKYQLHLSVRKKASQIKQISSTHINVALSDDDSHRQSGAGGNQC